MIREAQHEQSWTAEEEHCERVTSEPDGDGMLQTLEANEIYAEYRQLSRSDEMREIAELFGRPSTAEDNHFKTEEAKPASKTTSEEEDRPGFGGETSTVFNNTVSDSVGCDGLSIDDKEEVIDVGVHGSDEYTGNASICGAYLTTQDALDNELCRDRKNQTSSVWQTGYPDGSCMEETVQDRVLEGAEETDQYWNDMVRGGIGDEMKDDVANRCDWDPDSHDIISTQMESWHQLHGGNFEQYRHNNTVVPEPEDQSLPIHEEMNESSEKSTEFVLPASSIDDIYVEDRSHHSHHDNDLGHRRIVGRRWEKKTDSGTSNTIQVYEGEESHGRETDQSEVEQDTLPRRGQMKALLAQWRELEQRRKDEELIERAAAVNSERSRRAAVRTAWFKAAPDTDQQRGLAATRSRSCGPVTRRPTADQEFDGSSGRRNGSVDDVDESETAFDRTMIKEKFERLDAEAQRAAIVVSRKKVSQTTIPFSIYSFTSQQVNLSHGLIN